jgi:hypothetical protein
VEMPLPTAGLGELLGSVQHGALGTRSVSVIGPRLTVCAWWSLPGTFTCAGVRHMKVIGRGDPSLKPFRVPYEASASPAPETPGADEGQLLD